MSLCVSDMFISLTVVLYVGHQATVGSLIKLSASTETCVTLTLRALRVTSHLITLLNLLGLAIDHYITFVQPLDYPTLLSRKRANSLIAGFWILACVLGLSDFYLPGPMFSYCDGDLIENYCERVLCSKYSEEYILFALALLCFVVMSVLYACIYQELKRSHPGRQMVRNNLAKNKKGLITTVIILLIFMVCWLPFCLFEITVILAIQLSNDFLATVEYFQIINKIDLYLFDLLLLNCILDAIVYSARMREVQQGYSNMMRRCGHKEDRRARASTFRSTIPTLLSNQRQSFDLV